MRVSVFSSSRQQRLSPQLIGITPFITFTPKPKDQTFLKGTAAVADLSEAFDRVDQVQLLQHLANTELSRRHSAWQHSCTSGGRRRVMALAVTSHRTSSPYTRPLERPLTNVHDDTRDDRLEEGAESASSTNTTFSVVCLNESLLFHGNVHYTSFQRLTGSWNVNSDSTSF